MKKIIICLILIFSITSLKSQSRISIGVTPAFTYNINNPTSDSRINDFDIISNYLSVKAGIFFLLELKHFSLTLNTNYHWNKYGWWHTYNKNTTTGSIYNFDEVILSTESISGDLISSIYITRFFHNKSLLIFDIGGGYSFIQHTQLYGHYIISIHNSSFSKVLTYNQADVGSNVSSPFVVGGISIQAILRKIGKIKYGIHYTYYIKTLPKMNIDLEINNEVFTSYFQTKHSYFELFLNYFILNFEKRQKNDKCHKFSYK